MSAPRLTLKQPTGWFAAGREVALAMTLLSDGAFKLYLYLCLQAERHTGRVVLHAAEWTQALGKDPAWIETCLGELYRNHVCKGGDSGIEIRDRFWPYEKQAGGAATTMEAEFVRQVRAAFLKPACVRSVFTAADEKLALHLYRREVLLEQVRRAIWLGCARKYVAMLNGQTSQPITSLAYFASSIEEARQPQVPASYWDHVRRRMEEMERRWRQAACSPPGVGAALAEPPPPEML